MTNGKLAPTALFSALIESIAIGTANGDNDRVQECVRAVATHFSPQTVLGSIVYGHKTIQDARERRINESARAVVLDRVRGSISRFSRTTIEKAYRAAFKECMCFVDSPVDTIEPTAFDSLVDSWSKEDHIQAIEIENDLLQSQPVEPEYELPNSQDYDPVMVEIIAQRAVDILREVVDSEFSDDPRQADLLTSWADGTDRTEIMNKSHGYVSEVYTRLSGLSALDGIVGDIVSEACTLCEDILKEQKAWNDPAMLKAVMIVLDTDNTLKKGGH